MGRYIKCDDIVLLTVEFKVNGVVTFVPVQH
jgi:hypothetical protein